MKYSALALHFLASTVFAAPAQRRVDVLPTILFTPGAWHGTWAFDTVRASLEGLGYPTDAVALSSVGSTDATVGVTEDAAALAAELAVLTSAGKDVVMVCHSYGGVVASTAVEGYGSNDRAAAGLSGGVIMLVYMTAFAAPANTSLLDALGGVYLPWMIETDSTGDFVFPATPEEIFYADVANQTLVAEAVAALKAEPARIFSDDNLYEPWSNGVEVGWFFTEQDQAIPLATQQAMASQFPTGYLSYTMNSSHSPFLSMPDKVVTGVVLAATQGLLKKPLVSTVAGVVSTVTGAVSGIITTVTKRSEIVSGAVGNVTSVVGGVVGGVVSTLHA